MSKQSVHLSPTCTQMRHNHASSLEACHYRSQFPNLPGFRRNISTAPQSPKVSGQK